jgi:hypothetical protein
VVRFVGTPADKVDVNLSRGGGTLMATWPRAQDRSSGALWRSLALQDRPGGDGLTGVESGSAFAQLRANAAPFIVDGKGGCEPFLLYDAELPFTCPVKVEASTPAGVRMTNGGKTTVRDLTLFRHANGGWATASFAELNPAPPPPPVATPASRPATHPTTRAATAPATQASTRPAGPPPTVLAVTAGSTPEALAAAYVKRTLPDLSDGDRSIVTGLMVRYGFDGGRLTAAYRLDQADMDRMLPLEVLPQPKRIVRVGLILLRNIDPAAGTDVDDLIGQLGDNAWAKRESATKALTVIGPAAAERLRAAAKSPDAEVAWRAERILAAAKVP